MIRRITLQNYMSHTHTVIEPAAGLTVLVGPNNCGKSAVVSALETLCYNATGSYMVRHDEKEAQVTVETDDDHSFVWKRKGGVVSYVIDGRGVHRVGRSVPDDLQKLLRLPLLKAWENGEPFEVHFGNQKTPIFLLDESETRAALFFASSSDASVLLEMQKRHRNKVREGRIEERRLRAEIEQYDAELASLKPVDAIAISTVQAEGQYREIVETANRMRALGSEIRVLDSLLVTHDRLGRDCQCLAAVTPLPELADVDTLATLADRLAAGTEALHRYQLRSRLLATLTATPELRDVSALERAVDALVAASESQADRRRRYGIVQELRPLPGLDDVTSLEAVCQRLQSKKQEVADLLGKAQVFARLPDPLMIGETVSLETVACGLEAAEQLHNGVSKRCRILASLTSFPALEDSKTLEDHLRQWEGVQARIESQRTEIDHIARLMQGLNFDPNTPARAGDVPMPPRPAMTNAGRSRVRILAGAAVIVLLLAAAAVWMERRVDNASHRGSPPVSGKEPGVATGHEAKAGTEIPRAPADTKELPEAQPAKAIGEEIKPVHAGPAEASGMTVALDANPGIEKKRQATQVAERDANPEPRGKEDDRQAVDEARLRRLQEIRKQLDDAETAARKGEYLNALLGFGQAVLHHQQELSEVEDPGTVRIKFLDALRHYQEEVEGALRKAAERKPTER